MSYQNGVFSLFNQGSAISNLYADLQAPTFSPPSGFLYVSVYGKSISPTIVTAASGAVSSAYGQQISSSISTSTTLTTAYGLSITGPLVQAGTVSNAYSLYVSGPSITSGGIANSVGAFFALPSVGTQTGGVGIGTSTPMNSLDVSGAMAVGVYAGSQTLSSGVLAVSGSLTTTQAVGVGNSNPQNYLDVQGGIQAGSAYGWMPMGGQQRTFLSQGQNGSNVSYPGTNKYVGVNSVDVFDLRSVSSILAGFNDSLFDGRYIYFIPRYNGVAGFFGIICRYDTSLPFNSSTSYAIYDVGTNVNPNCIGMAGGAFDGRYLYFACRFNIFSGPGVALLAYDSTLPFTSSLSYQVFITTSLSATAWGYTGGIFDGQYVYFAPSNDSSFGSSLLLQYNTRSSFVSTSSYRLFDLFSLGSYSSRISIGTFDGRYAYFVPQIYNATASFAPLTARITRYDITLPFSVSSSYSTFNVSNIPNNQAIVYNSASYDGKYIYFAPNISAPSGFFSSQLLRYDTTSSFTSTASYSVFDAISLNTLAAGYGAVLFDGRYCYFMSNTFPSFYGIIVTYDTLLPFNMTTSYQVFDFSIVNTAAVAFVGGSYDGTYIYTCPGAYGVIGRISAYPATPDSLMTTSSRALNGFRLGVGITNPITTGSAPGGTISVPSLAKGFIMFSGGRGGITKIPYF